VDEGNDNGYRVYDAVHGQRIASSFWGLRAQPSFAAVLAAGAIHYSFRWRLRAGCFEGGCCSWFLPLTEAVRIFGRGRSCPVAAFDVLISFDRSREGELFLCPDLPDPAPTVAAFVIRPAEGAEGAATRARPAGMGVGESELPLLAPESLVLELSSFRQRPLLPLRNAAGDPLEPAPHPQLRSSVYTKSLKEFAVAACPAYRRLPPLRSAPRSDGVQSSGRTLQECSARRSVGMLFPSHISPEGCLRRPKARAKLLMRISHPAFCPCICPPDQPLESDKCGCKLL